jgi:poly-gamma-glutamate synthesis protein (capsule biosynthesis protein)
MTSVSAAATQAVFGPADPGIRDVDQFDPKRPPSAELALHVPDGFTVGAVGDLIISRPLSQYDSRLPGFKAVLDLLHHNDALCGNMESTIFDARAFNGAPYSWDGDWTNSSLPAVAQDLHAMGFGLVSRANNHVMDWGPEGMRETGRWLDEAGIIHAGTGENRGLARAAQFLETVKARVALVSVASTFRPTTEALPTEGAAPGRPGLSALHLTKVIELPEPAMAALAAVDCASHGRHCGTSPAVLDLFETHYRVGPRFAYAYRMDDEDLAEILKSIREAKQNADFVIVSIHSHECSIGCDDDEAPRGPGDFLKPLAHAAVDSGADLFVTTGNHNLGPIEIYDSPIRGRRPIFYGLGNFFWSDIQLPLPHDLFQGNRAMLAKAWVDPTKATDYDLTAPLNRQSFAHEFTFHGVIAQCRFQDNALAEIRLHPVEEGYGAPLTESGIPRLVTDRKLADAIIGEITAQTKAYGLPDLHPVMENGATVLRP